MQLATLQINYQNHQLNCEAEPRWFHFRALCVDARSHAIRATTVLRTSSPPSPLAS